MQTLTVAAISTRNQIGQPDIALSDMRTWTEAAARQGAEFILFPELNVTGYIQHPIVRQFAEPIPGPSTEKAVRLARDMGVILACGILEREDGYYALVCNSAEDRAPGEWEPDGARFPGWAGAIDPWGQVLSFVDREGNDEAMVVVEIGLETLQDRRNHPNFLARELRPALYQLAQC